MKAFIPLMLLTAAAAGCSSSGKQPEQEKKGQIPAAPIVTDKSTEIIFSWFADGGSSVATSVSGVPSEARSEVRVQDTSIPPEKRDPNWIFLADLTAPGPNGGYPVRAEKRSEYEAKRLKEWAARNPPAASESQLGNAPQVPPPLGSSGVIMYATRHCPVCKQARRWLLEQKIPYVEKDVELDPNAASELAKKGQSQGVSTSGVPVFDIGGRLVPGFEPDIIKKLVAAMPTPSISI